MEDYEKLGTFYLGRPYNLAAKKPGEGLLLYDSKDLVTHGVCIGMTGSGKTGLCIAVLEEAGIDNIPAIVIDPKGDLSNLLLTFPELRPDDFLPWINSDDARRKGLSPEQFAQQQAALWKKGIESWHQDSERIRRLRQAVDFMVYTPGSNAGMPVSILKSFARPPLEVMEDTDLLRDRIMTTATSLLSLLGIQADPIKSREHILISTIFDTAWREGRDLTLESLIQQIQQPPFTRIGVLNVDTFYPARERFELSLQLNNLLAAPGFDAWMEGEALDISSILYTAAGKPRISIFSIAHLSDSERMFFVSLLLNQIVGWMRTQSGTTSLRAVLYMDEIFGYFPPVANPPSKPPLLTLLKQARAYGLGVLLATQNPVDLDYKGLANTGTWFIGRLQTERDKARVLEGLEGAAAASGTKFDSQSMAQTLAGLGSRIFLLNNVHEDAPVIFETRWVLSYLRGPLTRTQIKTLMDPIKASTASPAQPPAAQAAAVPSAARQAFTAAASSQAAVSPSRPVLPPEITNYYLPLRGAAPSGHRLVYMPSVLAKGQVLFSNAKAGITQVKDIQHQTSITHEPIPVNWDNAAEVDFDISDLEKAPAESALHGELPTVASKLKNYDIWGKSYAAWLYRNERIELLQSPVSKEYSRPGEEERDFRIRLQQTSHENRDTAMDVLRKKYASKIATLEDRIHRAQLAVDREAEQAKQQKMQTAVSVGATLLGAFMGRKALSTSTLGRATTSVRGMSRSRKEAQDVGRAQENVKVLQARLEELETEFKSETDSLAGRIDPLAEELEHILIKPAKKDITVQLAVLCWLPYWKSADGTMQQAW